MHRTATVLQRAYDEVLGLLPPPLPTEPRHGRVRAGARHRAPAWPGACRCPPQYAVYSPQSKGVAFLTLE